MAPFPLFMPDPPKQLMRVKKEEGVEEPPPFKPSTKEFTRPTPSVVTNRRNIRSAFPTVFRH